MVKKRKGFFNLKSLMLSVFGILCMFAQTASAYTLDNFTITKDQTVANKFTRHTVTGITTPLPVLPDVPGFPAASYVTIEDIDGDGIKEIIATSGLGPDLAFKTADGTVALFTWDGVNMDSWTQTAIDSELAFPNETFIRDMDNDGDNDIVVMDNFIAGWFSHQPAGIYYLENLAQDAGGDGDITDPLNWRRKTIFQGVPFTPEGEGSYHRAFFMDVDNDGLEDFVTSKICMGIWQTDPYTEQYAFAEWYKKEAPPEDGTNYSGPYLFGDAGGFLFEMIDLDNDGDRDYVASQFFISNPGGLEIKGAPDGSDPRGDSLVWLENPGSASLSSNPGQLWNRHTIDNWYTSSNPLGKGIEVIGADIDNDGVNELVYSSHNHQDYKYGNRIWPSGVYYFEIPEDPTDPSAWTPITIDAGDPNLDPDNATAVANDVYSIDRAGTPYDQGSPGMVRAEDISGDSYPDLVVPGDGKGTVYYYQSGGINGSTMSYARSVLYEDPGCMPGAAEIADIDGDGDKDIISVIFDTGVEKASAVASSSIFVFEQLTCSSPYSDVDGDGTCDELDNCPSEANPGQEDSDGDGVGDACDNCLAIVNADQADADSDGSGDVCDEYTVYGTIDPVIPATIEIYTVTCGVSQLVGTTTTDQNGYYAVGGLQSGELMVVPIASGYSFVPLRSWPVIPQAVIQSYDFTAVAK